MIMHLIVVRSFVYHVATTQQLMIDGWWHDHDNYWYISVYFMDAYRVGIYVLSICSRNTSSSNMKLHWKQVSWNAFSSLSTLLLDLRSTYMWIKWNCLMYTLYSIFVWCVFLWANSYCTYIYRKLNRTWKKQLGLHLVTTNEKD